MRFIIIMITTAILAFSGCVIGANEKIEEIATGFKFTEGPVWSADGKLLFSDIPANKIYVYDGKDAEVLYDQSGNSNGLIFDFDDRLIACEHGNRRVARYERDGSITVLADKYEGKKLNSPNDLVMKSDGSIYFTDPTYGIKKDEQELDFQGVYRITKDGKLELLCKDFSMPNGLCFSPDEKKLYIADSSERRHIRVFDVKEDGTISGGEIFATVSEKGIPDGMKVDKQGNLYVAGPGGVWIFDSKGLHIKTIKVPQTPSNLNWQGKDEYKVLYVTAVSSVYKITLKK
ncbi:MAG: SMP-30/gluconolactonase/LRE family protein [Armatimonadota bacterium]